MKSLSSLALLLALVAPLGAQTGVGKTNSHQHNSTTAGGNTLRPLTLAMTAASSASFLGSVTCSTCAFSIKAGSSLTITTPQFYVSSGVVYGARVTTSAWVPEATRLMWSKDGAVQSSGTVMIREFSNNTGGPGDFETIMSSNAHNGVRLWCVLAESCAPSTWCSCVVHGPVRVNNVTGGCGAAYDLYAANTRGAVTAVTATYGALGSCYVATAAGPAWILMK